MFVQFSLRLLFVRGLPHPGLRQCRLGRLIGTGFPNPFPCGDEVHAACGSASIVWLAERRSAVIRFVGLCRGDRPTVPRPQRFKMEQDKKTCLVSSSRKAGRFQLAV